MAASGGPDGDLREVGDVERLLLQRVGILPSEPVAATVSARRVLAEPVGSPTDMPPFDRASLDGYAVKADDTEGAAEFTPVTFTVVGDSFPGNGYSAPLERRQAVRVPSPVFSDKSRQRGRAFEFVGTVIAIVATAGLVADVAYAQLSAPLDRVRSALSGQ